MKNIIVTIIITFVVILAAAAAVIILQPEAELNFIDYTNDAEAVISWNIAGSAAEKFFSIEYYSAGSAEAGSAFIVTRYNDAIYIEYYQNTRDIINIAIG